MDIKKLLGSLITIFVVGVFAYFVWGIAMYRAEQREGNNQVACTTDAMQCADGTWVGRTGPSCTFVCPASPATFPEVTHGTVRAALGEGAHVGNLIIMPLAVVEDSRCPVDVQCIQAGTVRVSVSIVSGMGTSQQVIGLNQTVTTEAESIKLVEVTPQKKAGSAISNTEYHFVFEVSNR